MKHVIVAPVVENAEALFEGVREFPTEKVVMLVPQKRMKKALEVKDDLARFRIPSSIIEMKGDIWEFTFNAIGEIKSDAGKEVMVNVGAGDSITRCAAISAAFVNGLKAFDVTKDGIMMLPVLKFSYYRLIPERKMKILQILCREPDNESDLETLRKKMNISLPLLSYHINGNAKSEGLVEMGLAEVSEKGRRVRVALTSMGRLIIRGKVPVEEPPKKRRFDFALH
ncbi:MAG: hypothetical protein HYW25_02505 [Candidatus Aenigmarchaeota archaeon]|nr:hypothetical protein [Candidatus Aenigmarchaeota archaeon]